MTDRECVTFLQWALPQLHLRWAGFRQVRRQVCKRIGRRLRVLGLNTFDAYRAYLQEHQSEWELLDTLCRVTISRFYRDRDVFIALEREVLPALAHQVLAHSERKLAVWSAGCASGEEPYSLALLWRFALQEQFPRLSFEALATDADPRLLTRARRGCYPAGSLKELPETWRAQAFEPVSNLYCLKATYRTAVTFLEQDLRTTLPTGPFHLVLCRNLAFTYFDTGRQRECLHRLWAELAPGGALVIGAREALPKTDQTFEVWNGQRSLFRRLPAKAE